MEQDKKELFDEYLQLEKEGINALKKIADAKPNKIKSGKNNYTFNNCTVTINEEGKAIEILQAKEKTNNELMKLGMEFLNKAGDNFTKYQEQRAAARQIGQPKQGPMSENQKKTTSVKRKKKPVVKKKTMNNKYF